MLDTDQIPGVDRFVPSKTALEAVYSDIGRRIAFLRNERRISQGELGRRLNPSLTRAAISNIESGRQRLLVHVLLDVASVLGVDAAEILRPSVRDGSPVEEQLRAQGLTAAIAAAVARVSAGAETP